MEWLFVFKFITRTRHKLKTSFWLPSCFWSIICFCSCSPKHVPALHKRINYSPEHKIHIGKKTLKVYKHFNLFLIDEIGSYCWYTCQGISSALKVEHCQTLRVVSIFTGQNESTVLCLVLFRVDKMTVEAGSWLILTTCSYIRKVYSFKVRMHSQTLLLNKTSYKADVHVDTLLTLVCVTCPFWSGFCLIVSHLATDNDMLPSVL